MTRPTGSKNVKEELTMKTNKPSLILLTLISAFALSACGKTERSVTSNNGTASGGGGGVITIPTSTNTSTYTNTGTNTSTNTNVDPPYVFEINGLAGDQIAQTPPINTDNVLKVKFQVTAGQGNTVHQATELKVTIRVNGTEVTPQYTSDNWTYGKVGETSKVIDLSSYVTPGVDVKIQVKNPMNDFYCTYWGGYYWDGNGVKQKVNPLYGVYPGCRKEVKDIHKWSGTLIVQTSSTKSI
jgi:hypothetical protein